MALPLIIASCSPYEDDLFSMSAIERLEADAESTMELLCSAENGWEMLYFLNEEEDIPCYTLLVKFRRSGDDGVAQFASYSDVTNNSYLLSEESPFTMSLDNSTVLSFNTYNSLFHIFSDPTYTGTSSVSSSTSYSYGSGMLGDYEFMVVDHSSDDEILLKGKKRQTYTVLRRLADDIDWQDYFTQLNAQKNVMFSNNPAPLRLTCGDRSFHLYSGSTSIFQVVDATTDDGLLTAATDWKFVLALSGLRFINEFDEEGVSAGQDFYYNADSTRLESYDDNGNLLAYIEAADPYWFFNYVNTPNDGGTTANNWGVIYDGMGTTAKALYDRIYATAWGQAYSTFQLTFSCNTNIHRLGISGSGIQENRLYCELTKTVDDEAQTVSYHLGDESSYMYVAFNNTDGAMEEFYSYFDNGESYTFEVPEPFNLSTLRMVNVNDPEFSFIVEYK